MKIILAGCLIAAVTYSRLFPALTHIVNPALEAFQRKSPITVTADASTCQLHIFVTAFTKFSNCDRAQDLVTKLGLSFKTENVPNAGDKVTLRLGSTTIEGFDAAKLERGVPRCRLSQPAEDKDGKIVPKAADRLRSTGSWPS